MSLVLLVDDDEDIRDTLRLLLEDEGDTVVTAPDGREALRLLSQGLRPDLVVLDLMMPVMSGWELRERMLRDPAVASIPTVVMTGDRTRPDGHLHAAAALAKPFDADRFLALIHQLLPGQPPR